MKKLFALLIVFISSLTLIACGEQKEQGQQIKPGVPVITYCSWNLGTHQEMNLFRRQIYKFNEERDDVQIKIVEPEGDYGTFLQTKASGRELPDVFMVKSVPSAVIGYLAKDITSLATADDEWETLDKTLVSDVTYNDRIYGIPCGQYYQGLFANMTLLKNAVEDGQDPKQIFAAGNFTTEQLITAVQNLRNITNITDGSGTIGINNTGDMINWVPSTLDTTGNIKHFVYNSKTKELELTSDLMYDAIRLINRLSDKTAAYSFENVEDKEKVFGPGNDVAIFTGGKMGFLQSGTWEALSDSRGVLDVEFVGYGDGRVVSVSDYMCISRATKTPELAFEVAKYLSYGVEGTLDKFECVEEANDKKISITGLPVVNNEEIAEKWFEYITLDGVKEVYEKVCSGEMTLIVEGNKSIPGYQEARFDATTLLSYTEVRGGKVLTMTDFIWDVCSGTISIDTYISDMDNTLATQINKYIKDAYAAIEDVASKSK